MDDWISFFGFECLFCLDGVALHALMIVHLAPWCAWSKGGEEEQEDGIKREVHGCHGQRMARGRKIARDRCGERPPVGNFSPAHVSCMEYVC